MVDLITESFLIADRPTLYRELHLTEENNDDIDVLEGIRELHPSLQLALLDSDEENYGRNEIRIELGTSDPAALRVLKQTLNIP